MLPVTQEAPLSSQPHILLKFWLSILISRVHGGKKSWVTFNSVLIHLTLWGTGAIAASFPIPHDNTDFGVSSVVWLQSRCTTMATLFATLAILEAARAAETLCRAIPMTSSINLVSLRTFVAMTNFELAFSLCELPYPCHFELPAWVKHPVKQEFTGIAVSHITAHDRFNCRLEIL